MKAVTAREANQGFSDLLSQVERGDEVLITKHGKPVAVIAPYRAPEITAERESAIAHAMALMEQGLPWPNDFRMPSRDEMHER
jgi:prevent-host-death family protein